MMNDLFADRSGRDPERAALIKGWVRVAFQLDDAASVFVSELACREPGCPPVETVVAVLGDGPPRQHKIHKPMADVTLDDLVRMAAASLEPDQSDAQEQSP